MMKMTEQGGSSNEGGKSTETIGFRLDSQALSELRKLAKDRKISLNSLMGQVIDTYLKTGVYDRRFGFFQINKDALRHMMGKMKDKDIAKMADLGGARVHRPIIMFLYGKVNKETVITYLSVFGNRFETFRHFKEGRKNTIAVYHAVNREFSLLYYTTMKSILSLVGIEPIESEKSISEEGFSIVFES